MPKWLEETEELVHSGRIKVPYTWWVGETGTDFFNALMGEKKIMGTYCSKCEMVFIPPRKACGRCFNERMEWRDVGPEGTLITYTVPGYRSDIHPLEPGFAYGIIKLDSADTGITHLISEYEEGEIKAGMRLEAVFNEEPQGNILDIKYFRPVK